MSQTKNNIGNGCLWIFITFLFAIISYGILQFCVGLEEGVSFLFALIISIYFTYKLLGKPAILSLLINFVFITLALLGLRFVGSFLKDQVSPAHEVFTEEELVTTDFIIENNDTIAVYKSKRAWKDNYGNFFTGNLAVRKKDFKRLKKQLYQFTPKNSSTFWGDLYKHMEQQDQSSLDLVMATFTQIHQQKNLNQMEFAEMVVSCIQDIPYAFVFQDACLPASNYEDDIRRVLDDCPDCCIGNIKYGVQNPVSFIKNLKGDCDTRTVLIYSILKHFNYDVAIANSDFYRHSILGLNIAATGKQKKYKGKLYTLWETTSKYYPIGKLPSNTSDTKHWNIVLTSK